MTLMKDMTSKERNEGEEADSHSLVHALKYWETTR